MARPAGLWRQRLGWYRFLLSYAGRYRLSWGVIVVATVASTAATLAEPWPLKILADDVLGHGSPPFGLSHASLLVLVALAAVAVFLAAAGLDVVQAILWVRVGQSMVYDLAGDVFARAQRRRPGSSVGDTMSRVARDSWSVHTVAEQLLFVPGHALLIITSLVVLMVRLSLELTVLAVVAAPLMGAVSFVATRAIGSVSLRERELAGALHAHVQQTLTGIPVVQAFGQEDRHHGQFRSLIGAWILAERRKAVLSSLNALVPTLVAAAGTAAVLLLGSHLVLERKATIGTLFVFVSYLALLQQQLLALARIPGQVAVADGGARRVLEVLSAPPALVERRRLVVGFTRGHVRPRRHESPPRFTTADGAPLVSMRASGRLSFDRVGFGYQLGRPTLEQVSFDVAPGEVVGVVGPTGAGKSTLVALAARLLDPDQGVVRLDGVDLRQLGVRELRQEVGVVFQESFLFPLSVADNIAYGRPGASRDQVIRAAGVAGADRFIRRLPAGYDTVLGDGGATLSGGERQRLALARAVVR
ncbi:MAG: ABC transporter ATP-binding protein, partial [Acidimicrobiales bacterium]|nr:ABC transporter ATP-binding protein [Acidimicrobiales bacterium]